MLTVYRSRKGADGSDEERQPVIPPHAPYLTKVNGKLVFARQKTPKAADVVIDLLGEAFGSSATLVRRGSMSLGSTTKTPLLISNSPNTQHPLVTYSQPPTVQLLQQQSFPQPPAPLPMLQYPYPYAFPTPNPQIYSPQMMPIAQFPPQYAMQYSQPTPRPCSHCSQAASQHTAPVSQATPKPQHYSIPPSKPTKEDFEILAQINDHYIEEKDKEGKAGEKKNKKKPKRPSEALEAEARIQAQSIKTDKIGLGINMSESSVAIHICASCGQARSKGYQRDNPIKAGVTPLPAMCRKCQKGANAMKYTDDERSSNEQPPEHAKKKNAKADERMEEPPAIVIDGAPKSKAKKRKGKKQPIAEEYTGEEEEPPVTLPCKIVAESYVQVHPQPPQGLNENWKPESRLAEEKIRKPATRERAPTCTTEEMNMYNGGTSAFPLPSEEYLRELDRRQDGSVSETGSRRRVHRFFSDADPSAPWNKPHEIDPESGDEFVVVTERTVYRKKGNDQQRHEEEIVDRHYRPEYEEEDAVTAEDAARHYQESWTKDERDSFRQEKAEKHRQGHYRRDENMGQEFADSESSDYLRAEEAVFHDVHRPMRSPAPPPEAWPESSRSQESSDRGSFESIGRGYGERFTQRFQSQRGSDQGSYESARWSSRGGEQSRRIPHERHYRDSGRQDPRARSGPSHPRPYATSPEYSEERRHRSPPRSHQRFPSFHDSEFERGAEEGLQESLRNSQALVISPRKRAPQRACYGVDSLSDLTEREELVERHTRRVSFRSPSPSDSVEQGRSDWNRFSDEYFMQRKTSWDGSDLREDQRVRNRESRDCAVL